MADAIVQTVKIEVEGADQAATEIQKVGTSIEDVNKTAAGTGGGTQELGKGLDQVSEKSSISGRELRSLSKIAKEFGADTAVVGLSLVRMATVLGPIGAALFAVAEAFAFVKDQMKATEQQTSAITTAFANIARVAAEVELDSASWNKASAAMLAVQQASFAVQQGYVSLARASEDASKQQINNALSIRSAQLSVRDAEIALAQAQGRTVSATTLKYQKIAQAQLALATAREREAEAEKKAERDAEDQAARRQQMLLQQAQLEKALADARETQIKVAANDVARVSQQIRNAAAGVKQAFDPLTTKDTLKKALVVELERAGIKLDDLTGNTKQATAAMRQAELEVAKIYDGLGLISRIEFKGTLKELGFTDEQIANITKGSKALKQLQLEADASSFENWRPALEKALASVSSMGGAIGTFFRTIGDSAVADFQRIPATFQAIVADVQAVISAWVTTPVGNAWQWIVDTFNSVGASLQSAASEAMAAITAWVTTPIANAWQWIVDMWNAMLAKLGFGGAAAGGQVGTTGGSFAGGGLLGGRGTGTSDSNLAWVSRGEHIMPARAVAQPGVLAFLEALRRSGGNLRGVLDGMGRFAFGGLVAPTLSIPAMAGGGMNNVTINFPGLPEITGLRASSSVVDELRKAAAMAQVRSGGRKPSRYS